MLKAFELPELWKKITFEGDWAAEVEAKTVCWDNHGQNTCDKL